MIINEAKQSIAQNFVHFSSYRAGWIFKVNTVLCNQFISEGEDLHNLRYSLVIVFKLYSFAHLYAYIWMLNCY